MQTSQQLDYSDANTQGWMVALQICCKPSESIGHSVTGLANRDTNTSGWRYWPVSGWSSQVIACTASAKSFPTDQLIISQKNLANPQKITH